MADFASGIGHILWEHIIQYDMPLLSNWRLPLSIDQALLNLALLNIVARSLASLAPRAPPLEPGTAEERPPPTRLSRRCK